MTTLKRFGALALAVLLFAVTVHAQTPPNAKAKVLGVSPRLVGLQIPGMDKPSNGLPNVGKGTKVYIYCGGKPFTAASGGTSATHFKSATFTFLEKPANSTAAFTTIDTVKAAFIADQFGIYRIEMEGTDNLDNKDKDTLVVHAGTYVGVGGIVGNATPPECKVCHAGIYDKWSQTNHSDALQLKLDDTSSTSHFGVNCIPCHATGSTDPAAEDGGWLHVARTLGWTFPTSIGPGTFDAIKANFPGLAKMAGIQCESCHGPGNDHNGATTDNKIASSASSSTCLQCHDAPTHHLKPYEWENSGHANSMNEPGRPEYLNRGSKTNVYSDCARCHTSNGYLDTKFKGNQYTNAPYQDVAPVGCITCHDPHDGTNQYQLRLPVAQTCDGCHTLRLSGNSGLHSSHQGDMIRGVSGKEFPGYTYGNSAHSAAAEKCATCHMAEPDDATLQNKVGGHTFKVLYDNDTPTDESDDVLNLNGCVECHSPTLAETREVQEQIKEKLNELKALFTSANLVRTNGEPLFPYGADTTKLGRKIFIDVSFNYYFVKNDLSYGVHNQRYAKALLEAAIAEMIIALPVELPGAVPNTFVLGQNYPNPFNPSTAIRISVPKAQNVSLAIYDATGKEVSVLQNGYMEAGNYQFTWNATVNNASFAPSGVYFYRLSSADGFVATKKMALMK